MTSSTLSIMTWRLLLPVMACALGIFMKKLIRVRMIFLKLRRQRMPMPEWSFLSGNLLVLPGLLEKFPVGSMQSDAFFLLSNDFKETDGCFYVDLWPFSSPLMIVTSPDLATQACQEHDLVKPDILIPFFAPLAGGPNLFDMNGAEWKRSRKLFNSGFGDSVMYGCVPGILDEADIYVSLLRRHASKANTFSLDKLTCDYMMDVIGVVVINVRLHSQTRHNDLAAAMRSSIGWHCQDGEMNPFKRWNPMRPLIEWWNGKTMDRYINNELDKRYEAWKSDYIVDRTKSVMDIAIASYMSERKTSDKLDAKFKSWAMAQIRTFLFGGHDSTAATIVYSLHLMTKHPNILAKVRAEHDEVFGKGMDTASTILREHPTEINRLPYTLAVIKETLRLFPPAAGIRGGRPGVVLRDKNGNQFPTEGLNIWIVHGAIQRNADYWPEPHSFLPERWLVQPGHPLYPPKGGWRPFEYGSRDCIGQNLAMLDIKITLALIVREFDFVAQYEEYDRLHPTSKVKTVFGERAYQIPQGAAHPVNGYPCKVKRRS